VFFGGEVRRKKQVLQESFSHLLRKQKIITKFWQFCTQYRAKTPLPNPSNTDLMAAFACTWLEQVV
jgi:hypothetical protein